jgi:isopenicillin N synthase-like dioxygenase
VTYAVPVIDIAPLVATDGRGDAASVAGVGAAIDRACRDAGFFAITGHGVSPALRARLDVLAREFFALPDREKQRIAMVHGGRAWRGWFPVGGELTSGRPDRKEGLYFGAESPPDDRPLHGPNLFPERPAGLRDAVLDYIDAMTRLGCVLMRAVATGLGLEPTWFERTVTGEPLVLFRIFHYPAVSTSVDDDSWGVGEHTDYGLLTILGQDGTSGLEVRSHGEWVAVPAEPGTFVCNVGDMLERMTAGAYRSTPHRVRNSSGRARLSFPFFFDPGWDARLRPVPGAGAPPLDAAEHRWDRADPHAFSGTYGAYLLAKVGHVFPALRDDVLRRDES